MKLDFNQMVREWIDNGGKVAKLPMGLGRADTYDYDKEAKQWGAHGGYVGGLDNNRARAYGKHLKKRGG